MRPTSRASCAGSVLGVRREQGRGKGLSFLSIALVWVFAAAQAVPSFAAEPATLLPGQEKRRVLALYDATEPVANRPDVNFVHTLLEMPLNRLGLVVDYHDVNRRPLPDPAPYRGIVIWFTDNVLAAPYDYLDWVARAARGGVRIVVVGGLGAEVTPQGQTVSARRLDRTYAALGLRADRAVGFTDNPFAIAFTDCERKFLHFETREPPSEYLYNRFVAADKRVRVWRSVRRTDVQDSEGVGIAVSPMGGFALYQGLLLREVAQPVYRARWDVNPFEFLRQALDCADLPCPDVTTAFGRRAAYSHIDADGYRNLSQDVPGKPRPSPQVIKDEILSRYPFPVTVGLIAGYIDPKGLGGESEVRLARAILALPNVQPGCHGYAHPLVWSEKTVGLKIPGYRFDVRKETLGAIDIIQQEVLQGRGLVEVYQWTGDCLPGADALALIVEAGIPQINGGNTRYDRLFDSLTYLSPLTRTVGPYRQVLASAQNEYTYTNQWTENYGGFAQVIETFRRTASPRLLPVNIYYHFYSGERLAALRALKRVQEWALKQPLCWLHTAEYVRSVGGFLTARLGRSGPGGYWVQDFGECRTLRLDGRGDKHVDMRRSTGVLGYTDFDGSLYVTLAPVKRAEIHLTDVPPQRPCLRESPAVLRKVRADARTWRAEARLYAPGTLVLQGFAPGASLSVRIGDGPPGRRSSDAEGRLTLPLPQGRGEWVEVHVAP